MYVEDVVSGGGPVSILMSSVGHGATWSDKVDGGEATIVEVLLVLLLEQVCR